MVEVKFYDNVADEFLKFAVIISKTDNKWVFCKHKERETYEIPGGHREPGESILETAKRELQEETGITNNDIVLTNIMNIQYKISDMELEVYAGKLNKDVKLIEEINKLYWMDKKENFFDMDKFAGEGNIGHMVQQVEIYKNK